MNEFQVTFTRLLDWFELEMIWQFCPTYTRFFAFALSKFDLIELWGALLLSKISRQTTFVLWHIVVLSLLSELRTIRLSDNLTILTNTSFWSSIDQMLNLFLIKRKLFASNLQKFQIRFADFRLTAYRLTSLISFSDLLLPNTASLTYRLIAYLQLLLPICKNFLWFASLNSFRLIALQVNFADFFQAYCYQILLRWILLSGLLLTNWHELPMFQLTTS